MSALSSHDLFAYVYQHTGNSDLALADALLRWSKQAEHSSLYCLAIVGLAAGFGADVIIYTANAAVRSIVGVGCGVILCMFLYSTVRHCRASRAAQDAAEAVLQRYADTHPSALP